MKLISYIIRLLYINRVAYAINENNYIDKDNPNYNSTFYRVEKVIIKDIFFDYKNIQYMCISFKNHVDWGDTIERVYFSKTKASKELLKFCEL